jgi:hypothetical protein
MTMQERLSVLTISIHVIISCRSPGEANDILSPLSERPEQTARKGLWAVEGDVYGTVIH